MVTVDDNQEDDSVLLTCNLEGKDIKWFKDGKEITTTNEKTWNLGSSLKDPQGTYWCQGSANNSQSLQVYYRSMWHPSPFLFSCCEIKLYLLLVISYIE